MDALERVKYVLAQLPREDQAAIADFLRDTLVTPEEAEAITTPDERVVATVTTRRDSRSPTVTYRTERVRCGKRSCTKCPHGPYVYKYWREDGRLRKRYVGKAARAPPEGPRAPAAAPKVHDAPTALPPP